MPNTMATGIHQAAATRVRRKAFTAFGLFAALCLAGIVTLCSQASFKRRQAYERGSSTWTSLDPGTAGPGGVAELLPAAIERGASPPGERIDGKPEPAGVKTPEEKILRLR